MGVESQGFVRTEILPLLAGREGKVRGSGRMPYFVAPRSYTTELANMLDSVKDTPIFGSDNNDGLAPDSALLTLQEAINRCKNDIGDRIICLRGNHVVTTPVLFNKRGIIVETLDYGMNPYDIGERFTVDATGTPGAQAAIISQPCVIKGLGFQGALTTGASVSISAGSGFVGNFGHIYRCRFDNWGASLYAIDSITNDYWTIEECDFDGTINGVSGGANNFTAGISIGQGHYMRIINNVFRGCTSAILHVAVAPGGASHGNMQFLYKGNIVIGPNSLVNFGAIATETNQQGLVCDNFIPLANTAAYVKSTGATTIAALQAINVLFSNNHYSE